MPYLYLRPNRELDSLAEGLEIIKRAEGFKPNWYLCPANVWTIGYGTTEAAHVPGVRRGTLRGPISRDQAQAFLEESLIRVYERVVERVLEGVKVTREQFSAMVSLVYNVGEAPFQTSTLVRLVRQGDLKGAAAQFERWTWARTSRGRVQLPGLVLRRRAERALFERTPNPVSQQRCQAALDAVRVVEAWPVLLAPLADVSPQMPPPRLKPL